MRRAIAWSAGTLLFIVFIFVISGAGKSQATYNGRTVEDWLYNSHNAYHSNWAKEKSDAEIAIMMLGDKAADPLSAILRLESQNWVVYNWQKIPFGDRVLSRPLKNVENLQIRQMALRYIFQHMPLTTEKSNILARLTIDAELGPEATRYLQSFQRQLRDEEIWKISQPLNIRLNAAKPPISGLLSTTNTILNEDRSL